MCGPWRLCVGPLCVGFCWCVENAASVRSRPIAPTFALHRRPGYHRHVISRVADILAKVLDRAGFLITLARLAVLDWLLGPFPETPTDTAIREQGERLRQAFPHVDFDDPDRHVR
jgi:hypothetical protein